MVFGGGIQKRHNATHPYFLEALQDLQHQFGGDGVVFRVGLEAEPELAADAQHVMIGGLNGAGDAAEPLRFSSDLHCAFCDIHYDDPSPNLFSFNSPVGACPTCRGFGRTIGIDWNLVVPDDSKTLAKLVRLPDGGTR